MPDLRYTLLADGSSDRALLPNLTWALRQQGVFHAIQPTWADLGRLRRRPHTLAERIAAALLLYPCDLLCVHRDAERESYAFRRAEIQRALAEVERQEQRLPVAVCVIPVRMQEAWLLFDEVWLRRRFGAIRARRRSRHNALIRGASNCRIIYHPYRLLHSNSSVIVALAT